MRTRHIVIGASLFGTIGGLARSAAAGAPVASLALTVTALALAWIGVELTRTPRGLALDVRTRSSPPDPRDLPPLRVPPGGRGPAGVSDDAPAERCPVCDRVLRRTPEGAPVPCPHPADGPDESEIAGARRLRKTFDGP